MDAVSPPDIGQLVRQARKNRGLTLEGVAERSGVSRSMLSAIERGTVNPTFSIVWALTQALGLDLASLEGGPARDEPIEHIHSYSTPVRRSADGKCSLSMLSPRRTVLPVEWYRLIMEPGGSLDSKPHAAGTFEHLTCLSGALSVTVDGRTVKAAAGDTLRYRADRAHCIDNTGKGESQALLLVAQPQLYGGTVPKA